MLTHTEAVTAARRSVRMTDLLAERELADRVHTRALRRIDLECDLLTELPLAVERARTAADFTLLQSIYIDEEGQATQRQMLHWHLTSSIDVSRRNTLIRRIFHGEPAYLAVNTWLREDGAIVVNPFYQKKPYPPFVTSRLQLENLEWATIEGLLNCVRKI